MARYAPSFYSWKYGIIFIVYLGPGLPLSYVDTRFGGKTWWIMVRFSLAKCPLPSLILSSREQLSDLWVGQSWWKKGKSLDLFQSPLHAAPIRCGPFQWKSLESPPEVLSDHPEGLGDGKVEHQGVNQGGGYVFGGGVKETPGQDLGSDQGFNKMAL
jgi:hypothetical protein